MMIKIQKKNFNLEEEIDKIKNKHSDIGSNFFCWLCERFKQ